MKSRLKNSNFKTNNKNFSKANFGDLGLKNLSKFIVSSFRDTALKIWDLVS